MWISTANVSYVVKSRPHVIDADSQVNLTLLIQFNFQIIILLFVHAVMMESDSQMIDTHIYIKRS